MRFAASIIQIMLQSKKNHNILIIPFIGSLFNSLYTYFVSIRTHENKIYFQVGDKVCCTKNGYISERDDENMQEEPAHDVAGTSQDIPRKNDRRK